MTKRGVIYGGIGAVCLAGLFVMRSYKDKQIDQQIKSPVLAPTETAKVIVDPRRHTITTVTRRSDGGTDTKATFLSPGGASVSVGKGGGVLVTSRSWGTEVTPFIGASLGSDLHLRAAAGLNLFYVQRWELGGGLAGGNDIQDIRAFVHVSYNPYANYFVSLGIDHKQTALLIAGIKF